MDDPRSHPLVVGESERRSLVRRSLASALRSGGYKSLTAAEVPTSQPEYQALGTGISLALLFGYVGSVIDRVDGSFAIAGLATVAAFGFVLALGAISGGLGAGFLLIAWAGLGYLQLTSSGHWPVTHLAPIVVVIGVGVVTRQVDVRSLRDVAIAVAAIPRAAPLIAPLVLVVLVLPALSQDVWAASSALDARRLGVVATLTVGILGLLVHRHLKRELPQVLAARAAALVASPNRAGLTRRAVRSRLKGYPLALTDSEPDVFLREAWPRDGKQYVSFIVAAGSTRLSAPLLGRLTLCILFVGGAVSVYLYAILSAMVQPAVATAWANERVPLLELHFAGANVSLPGGPFFGVTALLATLAVATFLAFVLLEERFAVALGDALLRLPVDRVLALALPFLNLLEERIAQGDPVADSLDIGAEFVPQDNAPSDGDQPAGGADRTRLR